MTRKRQSAHQASDPPAYSSRRSTSRRSTDTPPTRNQILQTNRPKLETRKLQLGRPVVISDFTEYHVDTTFKNLNLQAFINLKPTVFPKHIREFYSGFSFDGINSITLHMYTKTWNWTLSQFGEYLGVPHVGLQFYSDTHSLSSLIEIDIDPRDVISHICQPNVSPTTDKLSITHLLPECKIWAKIIDHNIYVKSGNHHDIQAAIALILYCLKTETDIDIAFFMAHRMNDLPTSRRDLPYGSILTNLFEHLHLPNAPTKQNNAHPLNTQSLYKMKLIGGYKRPRIVEQSDDDDDDDDDHDEIHVEPTGEGSSSRRHSHVSKQDFESFKREVDTKLKEHTSILDKIFNFMQAKMSCKCTDASMAKPPHRPSRPSRPSRSI